MVCVSVVCMHFKLVLIFKPEAGNLVAEERKEKIASRKKDSCLYPSAHAWLFNMMANRDDIFQSASVCTASG